MYEKQDKHHECQRHATNKAQCSRVDTLGIFVLFVGERKNVVSMPNVSSTSSRAV